MSSSEKDAAEHKLTELDALVRTMCRDLDPDCIKKDEAPFIDSQLDNISDAKDMFRKAVRIYLKKFASEISAEEKTEWEANMAATVRIALQHWTDVVSHFTPSELHGRSEKDPVPGQARPPSQPQCHVLGEEQHLGV